MAGAEVWFEDARSVRAKLDLVPLYGLRGVSYWNIMKFFSPKLGGAQRAVHHPAGALTPQLAATTEALTS